MDGAELERSIFRSERDGRRVVGGDRGTVVLWEVFGKAGFDRIVRSIVGHIVPFVWIVFVVVEFFGSVGPADVTPAGSAQGVVVGAVGGESGAGPSGVGIFEEGAEAAAVEGVSGRVDATEVYEGWVEVEEGDAAVGSTTGCGHFGDVDDEGDACGIVPEAPFFEVIAFADAPAVVGEEDDDGVVAVGAGVEGVENFADLGVDEGAGGEVALEDIAVMAAFGDLFVVTPFHPLEAGDGDLFPHPGHVVKVVRVERRQGEFFAVELVPEFFGRSEGRVRAVEADHEEEGIVVGLGEAFGSPGGDFGIGELGCFFVFEAAPMDGEVVYAAQVLEGVGKIIGDDREGLGTHASGVLVGDVLRHLWSPVVELASHHDAIALVAEVAG